MEIPDASNNLQDLNLEAPKRRILNISEKIELIKIIDISPLKKKEIAARYGIPINTLSTIYANRERFLQQSNSGLNNLNKMRMRMSTYPDIEEVLLDWYKKNQASNFCGKSSNSLRLMALQVAKSLGYHNFTASNGWIERFKVRHNLKFRKNKCKKTATQSIPDSSDISLKLSKSDASLNGNSSEAECYGDTESNLIWENVSNPLMELTEVKQEYNNISKIDCESHTSILPHSLNNDLLPTLLPHNFHALDAQLVQQKLDFSTNYGNCQRKFCSATIQNVEEAYNIIKIYIESHRNNVNEKTQDAMEELKKFISEEKDKRTQSKITDYFYLT